MLTSIVAGNSRMEWENVLKIFFKIIYYFLIIINKTKKLSAKMQANNQMSFLVDRLVLHPVNNTMGATAMFSPHETCLFSEQWTYEYPIK